MVKAIRWSVYVLMGTLGTTVRFRYLKHVPDNVLIMVRLVLIVHANVRQASSEYHVTALLDVVISTPALDMVTALAHPHHVNVYVIVVIMVQTVPKLSSAVPPIAATTAFVTRTLHVCATPATKVLTVPHLSAFASGAAVVMELVTLPLVCASVMSGSEETSVSMLMR